jgi:hypothetical protein
MAKLLAENMNTRPFAMENMQPIVEVIKLRGTPQYSPESQVRPNLLSLP